jgi:hypothetical protein
MDVALEVTNSTNEVVTLYSLRITVFPIYLEDSSQSGVLSQGSRVTEY